MCSRTQVSWGPQPQWVRKEDISHTMSSSLIFSFTLGAQVAALGAVCCTLFKPTTADRSINFPQTCFWCCYPRDQAVYDWHKQMTLVPARRELRAIALAKTTGRHFQLSFDLWTTKSFPLKEKTMYSEFKAIENTFFSFIFVYHYNPCLGPAKPSLPYLLLAHCLSLSPTA